MSIKQKLCELFGGLKKETANELEKIADDYAIDFGEWIINIYYANPKWKYKSTNELLKEFKKEKGL